MEATEDCAPRALIPAYILVRLVLATSSLFLPIESSADTARPVDLVYPCEGSDAVFAEKAETLIAAEIDAERSKFASDAEKLRPDPQLARIARRRSCDMAHGADFSHTDVKGHFIAGEMVHQAFSSYRRVAENFTTLRVITLETGAAQAFGPEEFASAAVDAWMKSPEHRANILNTHYRASGIGVVLVNGQAIATQIFGGP